MWSEAMNLERPGLVGKRRGTGAKGEQTDEEKRSL